MATIGLLTLHRVFPPARENNDAANSSEFNIQDSLATVETGTPASEPQGLLRFDDLTRVDDATLAAVIQEVEPDVMALALTGAKDELMERIMGQIPRQVAKTFRQQLTRLGPTRLRDVEAAQQLVAAAAARRLDPTHPVRRAA
jgi:flagellar motor switch protein FliG